MLLNWPVRALLVSLVRIATVVPLPKAPTLSIVISRVQEAGSVLDILLPHDVHVVPKTSLAVR